MKGKPELSHKTERKSGKGKRGIASEIARLSAGLATTALDLVVLAAAFGGGLILSGPRGKDLYAARKFSSSLKFAEGIFSRYEQSRFRQAVARAVTRRLVEREKSGFYQLTDRGSQHLENLLPSFKRRQKWDGRLWLTIYDVPEKQHRKRTTLRKYVEGIGCRMVQESVWLSVKDPREWLIPLVDDLRLRSKVIISCLGSGGFLGEEDTRIMVSRLFKVSELEKRYRRWLNAVRKTPEPLRHRHALGFLGILRQDPVIPLELLPFPWIGEEAKNVFESDILPLMGSQTGYLKKLLYSIRPESF